MKLGFISMPYSGHLNPMTALARRLKSRGHEIVFIGVPDVEPIVRAAGLTFVPYCENEYPLGSIADALGPVSRLHGMAVVEYACQNVFPGLINAAFENLGGTLIETGVELLVIDTVHFFLELVPMSKGIPYVHIWNMLHIDLSASTPPCFFSWPHDTSPRGIARNIQGLEAVSDLFKPMVAVARPYAEKMGLQVDWNNPASTMSKLAVISQTLRQFDFPGSPWPVDFHYTGPFHDEGAREVVSFPWKELADKPLIYVSLGTVVNGLRFVYSIVLETAAKMPEIQFVLSVGNNIDLDDLGVIPSNAIVVCSSPQIKLLKKSALCVTHAGLNTTLESLAQGVPMVAIPIGFDQPGVAARIAHHGVGEFIEVDELTVARLGNAMLKVLNNASYCERARDFQRIIAQTRGLDVAVDVIEQVLQRVPQMVP